MRRVDSDPAVTLNTTIAVGTQSGSNGPTGGTTAVDGSCAIPGNATALTTTAPNNNYSLQCLSQLMINVSHNLATNELINFLGMNTINNTMDSLGLDRSQLNRVMNDITTFSAGSDNLLVPDETVEFYRRMHVNQNGFLSAASLNAFWTTLTLDGNGLPNTKGRVDDFIVNANVPGWQTIVTLDNNKPGSNSWSTTPSSAAATFGDYAHKPQIAAHEQLTDAGRLGFANGNTIAFAVFADEGDFATDPSSPTRWHAWGMKPSSITPMHP